jgi:NADH-quinone oxidoreductase subunit J
LSASFCVVSLKNSIQSILGLIFCFVASSSFLLALGCEFFAFLFLIIYVGAIAVLFLFVLMMLELKHLDQKATLFHMLSNLGVPIALFLAALPFIKSSFAENPYLGYFTEYRCPYIYNDFYECYTEDVVLEIEVLGQLLYTIYALQFLITGLILTLAVLSIGILTINRKNLVTDTNELVMCRSFPNINF